MEPIKGTFLSTDEVRTAAYNIWEPECGAENAKAVIQLSHGMAEYSGRYTDCAAHFNSLGYIFAGNDHLGHGNSVETADDLGYITDGNGAYVMPEDVYKMTVILKERYPGKPVILMGHSMGSFVARAYLTDHAEELAGVILLGTAGPGAPFGFGRFVSDAVTLFRGERHRSKLITVLAFGSYNKRFKKEKNYFSWLSSDLDNVGVYNDDPLCGFTFTASAYHDMFELLSIVNSQEWAKTVPTDLPILLASGTDDPVGDYGKGVRKVASMLAGEGAKKMTVRLFKGDRHELLYEKDSADVYAYLDSWIASVLSEREAVAE